MALIGAEALASELTIYFREGAYPKKVRGRPRVHPSLQILVHESVHAWQWVNGGPGLRRHAIVEGIAKGKGAYDWFDTVKKAPKASWSRLGVEQQAQMVQEAYLARYFDKGELIDAHRIGSGTFEVTMPDGSRVDITKDMDRAWDQIRRNQGAPSPSGSVTFGLYNLGASLV